MLTITSLDEFRKAIAHKDEIREAEIAPGLISHCYMISAENTFDSPEARECRGIVFDKATGKVVGRPLHKFFNVNERPETHPENLTGRVTRLMDKRDGSMIHTVKVNDTFRLKSKKSFESSVAVDATAWINKPENIGYFDMCEELAVIHDATAIFEYTAPDARIVLPYKHAELRLLHIRQNESGAYWPVHSLYVYAENYGVNVVDEAIHYNEDGGQVNVAADIPTLIASAKVKENIEGWIVQFEDGDMVKIKTDWYLKRHRAMTFLRERDIAQLVLDEGLDDVKSLLVGDGVNIDNILQIEKRVVVQLNALNNNVTTILHQDAEMERKDFAIKYREHEHFGLLMAAYTGKEPDFKAYFERNILRENYTLRQLTLMDTTAEAE